MQVINICHEQGRSWGEGGREWFECPGHHGQRGGKLGVKMNISNAKILFSVLIGILEYSGIHTEIQRLIVIF